MKKVEGVAVEEKKEKEQGWGRTTSPTMKKPRGTKAQLASRAVKMSPGGTLRIKDTCSRVRLPEFECQLPHFLTESPSAGK